MRKEESIQQCWYVEQEISVAMEIGREVEETLRELRQYFKTGRTKSVTWRKNQLKAILDLVHDQEHAMFEALQQDLGKHPVEAYRDEVIIKQHQLFFVVVYKIQCKMIYLTYILSSNI